MILVAVVASEFFKNFLRSIPVVDGPVYVAMYIGDENDPIPINDLIPIMDGEFFCGVTPTGKLLGVVAKEQLRLRIQTELFDDPDDEDEPDN